MLTFAIKKKRTPSIAPKRHAPTVSTMTNSIHVQQTKVRHILRSPTLQPKLTIGAPNDKYEQEADRVADEVMRMPEPRLQRQVKPEEEEEEMLQAKPLSDLITPLLQRQVEPEEEEEPIQAKQTSGQTPQVSPSLEVQIQSLKGRGKSLSQTTLMRAGSEPSGRAQRSHVEKGGRGSARPAMQPAFDFPPLSETELFKIKYMESLAEAEVHPAFPDIYCALDNEAERLARETNFSEWLEMQRSPRAIENVGKIVVVRVLSQLRSYLLYPIFYEYYTDPMRWRWGFGTTFEQLSKKATAGVALVFIAGEGLSLLWNQSQWNQDDDTKRIAYRKEKIYYLLLPQVAVNLVGGTKGPKYFETLRFLVEQTDNYEKWKKSAAAQKLYEQVPGPKYPVIKPAPAEH